MSRSRETADVRAARRRRERLRRRVGFGVAAVVAVWLGVTFAVRFAYADRIMPGTSMAGLKIGGLAGDEARKRLQSAFADGRAVTLTAAGRRFVVTPEQAGYGLDGAASVQRALGVGRDGPLGGLGATIARLALPSTLEPVARLDRERLQARVAKIAEEVDRAVSLGALVADESAPDGIRSRPPRSGLKLDRDAAASAVASALGDRRAGPIELPVRRQSTVSPEAVQAVTQRAREYLRSSLRLRVGERTETLSQDQTAAILALRRTGEDRDGVALGVDEQAVEKLIAGRADELDRKPASASIRASANTPVVLREQGELSWRPRSAKVTVGKATTGRKVKRERAAAAIAAAVRRGRHDVRIEFERRKPRVTTAAARKVDSLLGTFTTPYVGGQPRVKNIGLMAKEVDGIVVAPGERFSLNGATGERTKAEGYVEAPFIADGRIVPSVGGGVSQFSTTLYNAAYFAGLQIETHRPHSFYIDRYPAGREATLNFPDIDLAWTNDTSAPVLIRTATDATSVTASIYGADHGRRVRASNGDRHPVSGGDFSITVTRVLRYRDGKVDREPFTTRYDSPPPPE